MFLREYFYIEPTKEVLREFVENEKENKPNLLVVKLQHADKENGNHRVYPKSHLTKAVDEYVKSFVNSGTAFGELDHREDLVVYLKNASHIIREIFWKGDEVMGKIELLDTPMGNIAKEVFKKGRLGISSRGSGTTQNNENGGPTLVGDDLYFTAWDLVTHPSTDKSYVQTYETKSHVVENLEVVKDNKLESILKDILKK